jgi:hypothetical protein
MKLDKCLSILHAMLVEGVGLNASVHVFYILTQRKVVRDE